MFSRRSLTFHRKFHKRKDAHQRGTSCELQDDALEKMFFHTPKTRKAFLKIEIPLGLGFITWQTNGRSRE